MRLFVAIDPGEALRRRIEIAVEEARALSPRSKWVRAEERHITLVFLGATDDTLVGAVAAAVGSAAARSAPLTLRVSGGASFGDARRPRVLWADVAGDITALRALQADVEAALVPLVPPGHAPEGRAFTPHITLARARDRAGDAGLARCAEALRGRELGEARVEEVILYRSDPSPGGAHYTPITRAPLGRPA